MTFAAVPSSCYLNGWDTAAAGFVLEEVDGVFDAPDRQDTVLDLPQGVGAVLSSVPGRVLPRTIALTGTIMATTATALETAKDALKAACADGLVEVRLVHRDVVFRGRLVGLAAQHAAPQLRSAYPAARATLRFRCDDPWAYARVPSLVGFGSTRVALPLGTAPSRGRSWWSAVITIAGAATTPTLTESDAAGNVLRQMVFTFNPTADDAIEVDVGRGLITRIQSGVRDNGMPHVTAGFAFPALDPADGDATTGAFPGLAVSSGVGVVRYYRSWR